MMRTSLDIPPSDWLGRERSLKCCRSCTQCTLTPFLDTSSVHHRTSLLADTQACAPSSHPFRELLARSSMHRPGNVAPGQRDTPSTVPSHRIPSAKSLLATFHGDRAGGQPTRSCHSDPMRPQPQGRATALNPHHVSALSYSSTFKQHWDRPASRTQAPGVTGGKASSVLAPRKVRDAVAAEEPPGAADALVGAEILSQGVDVLSAALNDHLEKQNAAWVALLDVVGAAGYDFSCTTSTGDIATARVAPNGMDYQQATDISQPAAALTLYADVLGEARILWSSQLSVRLQQIQRAEAEMSRVKVVSQPAPHASAARSGVLPSRQAINDARGDFNAVDDDNDDDSTSDDECKAAVEADAVSCAMPTSDDLLSALIEGVNSATTQQRMYLRYIPADTAHLVGSAYLDDRMDSFGFFSCFGSHVEELMAVRADLIPTIGQLREMFACFNPSIFRRVEHTHLGGTATVFGEDQLMCLLQAGEEPSILISALRTGICPSLRRLYYARMLRIPLHSATKSPLRPHTELQNNRYYGDVTALIFFATRRSRDKVRRRSLREYASREQGAVAQAMQTVMKADVKRYVGDSDRYFIHEDDADVIAATLVADRGVPEEQLAKMLLHLQCPLLTYYAHLSFLDSQEDPTIQIAPPCGFFPITASSLLIAPICYVTGDTCEQYELASAMFGQLWCRIQGPTPELLRCCLLFEHLVTYFAPRACIHAFERLRVPPLRLAVRWMLSGFAGLLDPQEVLYLWDILLSFHCEDVLASARRQRLPAADCQAASRGASSCHTEVGAPTASALLLLPVLAASIFVSRAPLVILCNTPEQFESVFKLGCQLRVDLLLQHLMFVAQ